MGITRKLTVKYMNLTIYSVGIIFFQLSYIQSSFYIFELPYSLLSNIRVLVSWYDDMWCDNFCRVYISSQFYFHFYELLIVYTRLSRHFEWFFNGREFLFKILMSSFKVKNSVKYICYATKFSSFIWHWETILGPPFWIFGKNGEIF